MKRYTIVVAVLMVLATGCRQKSAHQKATEVEQAETFTSSALTIRSECTTENPDWTQISDSLNAILPVAQSIDQRYKTTYLADLETAVQLCARGENVGVNRQIIAVSMDCIAVHAIREQLEYMPISDERQHTCNLIAAYIEAIRLRFTDCDTVFFPEFPVLERDLHEALQFLKGTQGAGVIMAVEDMTAVINRTYALCIIHELRQVEAQPTTPDAVEHLKRAEIFYQNLSERFQLLAKKEHQTLVSMLTGTPDAVNAKGAEDALQHGQGQGFILVE